ncbi:MAG: ribosome maturation factor RimP [Leptospiraceae bacterium]|nr:ribosome maturation factor RimP [Leptospiraceae bacterium]MCP5497811.1 ribosome maturation factor RimP [Leptospiraceae bacterium]
MLDVEQFSLLVRDIIQEPVRIYQIKVKPMGKHYLIELFLDNVENKYGSVTIGECEDVSRGLVKILNERYSDITFTLNVSSAGAERELRNVEDYLRFRGLLVKLSYKDDGELTKEGVFKIIDLVDTTLHLEVFQKRNKKMKNEQLSMNLKDVLRGNLYLDI